jgi:hypothetical protein
MRLYTIHRCDIIETQDRGTSWTIADSHSLRTSLTVSRIIFEDLGGRNERRTPRVASLTISQPGSPKEAAELRARGAIGGKDRGGRFELTEECGVQRR